MTNCSTERPASRIPQSAAQLYDEAQKILTESDAAIAPLYWKAEATLLSPKFTGLEYNSMSRMDLRNVKPAASSSAAR